ncbi:MAG: phosphate regulon transcriptional regulator PhoB [Gammaproteobacteria bacterium]|nr:phosphate regulon transcriptional regulator PhoB [Gammaproteobacteria bacterium]
MGVNILIVDDEPGIRQMLGFAIASDGYQSTEAGDAQAALAVVQQNPPDLILLDWMLPGLSGVDLARRLKRDPKTNQIPIIMLTALAEETEKVRGLDSGADDYVTKPFSTRELLARIRAVLRRVDIEAQAENLELNGLKIDAQSYRVTIDGKPLNLSRAEFRLLQFFMTHPERIYTRTQLLDSVWGDNRFIEERTVDVHIRRLRKLLSASGFDRHVQTVRGVGYRFAREPD